MNRRWFIQTTFLLMLQSLGSLALPGRSFCAGSNKFKKKSRIALIIDDIGFSRARLQHFLDLNIPLTFAVLPQLPNSDKFAKMIYNKGHEVMLHQPMEPYNSEKDPGPGAIYINDDFSRITRIMAENIANIPFAVGVNNHMGSKFTEHPEKLSQALTVIKKKNMFFIDSLTSYRSKAYMTAVASKVPAAKSNRFIDNIPEKSKISSQLHKLARQATQRDYAIGIGHPYPATAAGIKEFVEKLDLTRYSLVYASCLL